VSAAAVAPFPDDGLPEDAGAVPQPVASFVVAPLSPSTGDVVRPYDFSFDPARVGIASREWDFGDGTTSSEVCPSHRFETDGHYVVGLRVTTHDGRTGAATKLVRVSTHDVSIVGIDVPSELAAGQTVPVVVTVTSSRYPELVQIELQRSAGEGPYERVDLLTHGVPAQERTEFAFWYPVSDADRAVGSVRFRAVASIVGAADSSPADNSVTAEPTLVT
jgi:PKD repeat protein